MSAMEESPPPPDGQNEEDDEDQSVTRGPYFSNSSAFHFMTTKEYEKREELALDRESEYSFAYVRPMNAIVGGLENPHGSVRLSQGGTTVLAAVYGPSDVRMSKELPHRAAVDVLFRPKVTGSGNTSSMLAAGMMDPVMSERAVEQTITSILESVIYLEDHVQAGFNVIIHEVEDKGCLLSTCVNAAALALLNAGCSLRCVFCSVTVLVCGDKVVIDPSLEQIEESKNSSEPCSTLTYTLTNSTVKSSFTPQVLNCNCTGVITPSVFSKVYKLVTSTQVTTEIFNFFWRVISSDVVGVCGGPSEIVKSEKSDDFEDGEID